MNSLRLQIFPKNQRTIVIALIIAMHLSLISILNLSITNFPLNYSDGVSKYSEMLYLAIPSPSQNKQSVHLEASTQSINNNVNLTHRQLKKNIAPSSTVPAVVSVAPPVREHENANSTTEYPPQRTGKLSLDGLRAQVGAAMAESGSDSRPVDQLKKRDQNLEAETSLGRDINKSARGDCRTDYQSAGLIAPIFLVRDALTKKGCKW